MQAKVLIVNFTYTSPAVDARRKIEAREEDLDTSSRPSPVPWAGGVLLEREWGWGGGNSACNGQITKGLAYIQTHHYLGIYMAQYISTDKQYALKNIVNR